MGYKSEFNLLLDISAKGEATLTQIQQKLRGIGNEGKEAAKATSALMAAGVGVAVYAINKIREMGVEMEAEGRKARALGAAFDSAFAQSAARMQQFKAAASNLISEHGLEQLSMRLKAIGLSSQQIAQVLESSARIAASTGREAADVAETYARAVATGRGRALRALGIIVDQAKAEETYAAALGKTRKELTANEKIQAGLAAAVEATNKAYSAAPLDIVSGGLNNVIRDMENLKEGSEKGWAAFVDGAISAAQAVGGVMTGEMPKRLLAALGQTLATDMNEIMTREGEAGVLRYKEAISAALERLRLEQQDAMSRQGPGLMAPPTKYPQAGATEARLMGSMKQMGIEAAADQEAILRYLDMQLRLRKANVKEAAEIAQRDKESAAANAVNAAQIAEQKRSAAWAKEYAESTKVAGAETAKIVSLLIARQEREGRISKEKAIQLQAEWETEQVMNSQLGLLGRLATAMRIRIEAAGEIAAAAKAEADRVDAKAKQDADKRRALAEQAAAERKARADRIRGFEDEAEDSRQATETLVMDLNARLQIMRKAAAERARIARDTANEQEREAALRANRDAEALALEQITQQELADQKRAALDRDKQMEQERQEMLRQAAEADRERTRALQEESRVIAGIQRENALQGAAAIQMAADLAGNQAGRLAAAFAQAVTAQQSYNAAAQQSSKAAKAAAPGLISAYGAVAGAVITDTKAMAWVRAAFEAAAAFASMAVGDGYGAAMHAAAAAMFGIAASRSPKSSAGGGSAGGVSQMQAGIAVGGSGGGTVIINYYEQGLRYGSMGELAHGIGQALNIGAQYGVRLAPKLIEKRAVGL